MALGVVASMVALLAPAEIPPIIILIPPASPTASAAAAQLSDELALPARVEAAPELELRELITRARKTWPRSVIIALDPARNETWMMQPDRETVVIRSLAPRQDASPYALAIAAAELVRVAVVEGRTAARAPATGESSLELALSLGVGVVGSPGFERTLAQPVLGADVRLGSDRLWSVAGLRLRGPSSISKETVAGATIEYQRTDLSARIGFGPAIDRWQIMAALEAGISFASTRALRGSEVIGSSSRLPFWVGVGGEVHYTLWAALRARLSLEAARVLSPADFTGDGAIVFSEGDWRLQSAFALEWIL